MIKRIILFFTTFLLVQGSFAQAKYERKNDVDAVLLNFYGGYNAPLFDLSDRFGGNFSFGGEVEYMTMSNWAFGVDGYFLTGTNVKEDVAAPYRNPQGSIPGIGGTTTELANSLRGWYYGGHVAKLISLSPTNKRSGIRIKVGVGYLTHKIRIKDEFQSAAQFFDDYAKGYDRKTGGYAANAFVGYQYISRNRALALIAGIESTLATTKSLRSWDFDLRSADTDSRLDGLLGLKIGITLPIFVGDSKSDTYYD